MAPPRLKVYCTFEGHPFPVYLIPSPSLGNFSVFPMDSDKEIFILVWNPRGPGHINSGLSSQACPWSLSDPLTLQFYLHSQDLQVLSVLLVNRTFPFPSL